MIPIKDDNPSKIFPFVTILLILINGLVFVYMILSTDTQTFLYQFGAIPWEVIHFQEGVNLPFSLQSPIPGILTLVTSMFLHGGILHILGNMLYLWIFGDNIEAQLGHGRFLVFYLACGLIAALSHVFIAPNSMVPMVGASGAVSGVLGAYLIRFPRARVHVLFFFIIIIRVVRIPALIVLGFWFGLQVLNGFGWFGFGSEGSVAWFAHIGGFLAGILLVLLMKKKQKREVYRSPWK